MRSRRRRTHIWKDSVRSLVDRNRFDVLSLIANDVRLGCENTVLSYALNTANIR